jgi:hypothetical protein
MHACISEKLTAQAPSRKKKKLLPVTALIHNVEYQIIWRIPMNVIRSGKLDTSCLARLDVKFRNLSWATALARRRRTGHRLANVSVVGSG